GHPPLIVNKRRYQIHILVFAMMYDMPTYLRRSGGILLAVPFDGSRSTEGWTIIFVYPYKSTYFLAPLAGAACPGFGRLAPYLERPRRRFATPSLSSVPRTM